MGDFIDIWTRKLVEIADGIDEEAARELVSEIYSAATLAEVAAYEDQVAEREAEREE